MAPWWPCTLPGTSSSFSSLLHLPAASPGCCHLRVPSCLLPNGQNPWLEWSWAGLGGDLLESQGGHLPEKLQKPGLALEPAPNCTERAGLGLKGFQGLRLTLQAVPSFPWARRCPALIPSLSLPLINKPLEATGEEWSDISGGQADLLIYFSKHSETEKS